MATQLIRPLLFVGIVPAAALLAWPVFSQPDSYVRITAPGTVTALDLRLMERVEIALKEARIAPSGIVLDREGVSVRLTDAEARHHAISSLKRALGSPYTIAPDATPR
ncbi:MAG: hypothetical protein AB1831_02080 [Pseudomonadota bacterium]